MRDKIILIILTLALLSIPFAFALMGRWEAVQ